jgi:hypothetical protein
MIPAVPPPGWSAFDPHRVDELRRSTNSADAPCPFKGHDHHRLPWRAGGYRKGTDFHGDPPVSFRVSPTYVLEHERDNFIVGHNLLGQLEGKAETWRLDNENSEDALSFNVFRSLQEAGALAAAVRLLAGIDVTEEPELVVWGRRLGPASTHLVPELQAALAELEPWPGQKTEPDVILRVPGWGWIFIEAKLASPTTTLKNKPEKLEAWAKDYGGTGAFDNRRSRSRQPRQHPGAGPPKRRRSPSGGGAGTSGRAGAGARRVREIGGGTGGRLPRRRLDLHRRGHVGAVVRADQAAGWAGSSA